MEYTRFLALNAIVVIAAAIMFVGCRRSYSIYFFEHIVAQMEYTRFLALNAIVVIAAAIMFVGCRRSYSIYFFERDTKRVVFLEEISAIFVPVVLSVLLLILYLGAKRIEAVGEEGVPSRRTSLAHSTVQRPSFTELDSIPESSAETHGRRSSETSRASNRDSVDDHTGLCSGERSVEEELRPKSSLTEKILEQLARGRSSETSRASNRDSVDDHTGLCSGERSVEEELRPKSSLTEKILEQLARESEAAEATNGKIRLDNLPPRRISRARKSSILDDNELAVERKRSQIYKEIGRISFFPTTFGEVMAGIRRPYTKNNTKQSLFDVVIQLIGVHIPLWLSVVAVHITLVEVFNMKLYYLFYYYHPGMKLMAMVISILLGLFHEAKWTWFVNDLLGIAAAYVVIARVEVISRFF
ncbi:unnamed protein product [Gongylonema pulchrum]|uniref:Uncharacterized protein n=1 Tax=Gongylonema pulchrum TaxID=637853 RepID=A0A183DYA2_9BILA|nr:unnamed protein product [Gongylonema pulchrum]